MARALQFLAALAAGVAAASVAMAQDPPPDSADAARIERAYRACREQAWREAEPECRDAFRAYDRSAWRRGGVLTLVAENDAIVGPDADYTNGVGIIVSTPPRQPNPDGNVFDRIHAELDSELFEFIYGDGAEVGRGTTRFSFRFAQQLFTPEDLTRLVPDPEDRPYAAWTYASFGQVRDTAIAVPDADGLERRGLSASQIDIGVVGPSAGGEEIQRWFHRAIAAEIDPQGWGYQLNDEPGFALRHERKLITRCAMCGNTPFDVEWERHLGFALGNIDTSVSAGVGLRVGINMGSDYGPTRLHPSLDGSSYFVRGPASRFGGYLFAGAVARGVGRNIFLDGNTFADSANVQKKHLVGDAQFGAAALLGPVKLSISHIVRTEEFNGQGRNTQFDALGVSFRF